MYKIDKKSFLGVKNAGFTLIELLVVVLIIGVLAAVALPQYQRAVQKSRYIQMMIWSKSAANAAEVYRLANGKYPKALDDLDITLPGILSENKTAVSMNGYSCSLYMQSASAIDSVLCHRPGERDFLGYRIFLGTAHGGGGYCVAQKATPAELFCLSLGGKDPFNNGNDRIHYQLD